VIVLTEFPQRKHPRLKTFDYSLNGYYHVIICTKDRLTLLSVPLAEQRNTPAGLQLTAIGKIVEEQLLGLSHRYPFVKIDQYVIMPDHLHTIVVVEHEMGKMGCEGAAGASHRPTLTDIVCVFKSLSTRLCNQRDGVQGRKMWQTSFYDEIIKSEDAYHQIWQYIDGNPAKHEAERHHSAIHLLQN